MTATLKLKDDNETVDFLDGTNYKLQDSTFKISIPEKVESRVNDNFFAGRNLQRMEYGPRQITFDVRVVGSTQLAVSQSVSKIQRLLSRASSLTYLQGGAYNQNLTMVEGSDTGDQGVILQLRRGSDALTNITSEYTNDSTAISGLYTMRVISGDLEVVDNIFGSADRMGTTPNKYFRNCTLTLQVEPFILGPSTVISTLATPGYKNEPLNSAGTDNGQVNRLFIAAASVPGDVEALTRIGTKLNNSQGIIIARDAGISLLNCPSYPTLSSGLDDVFVYGNVYDDSNLSLKIKINSVGSPNQFQFSNNNGSSYGTAQNIVAWTPFQLTPASGGPIDAYAVFGSTTGFTLNQTWTFSNHQAYFDNPGSSLDTYTIREDLMGESGAALYSFYVNVPPGCRSRYKFVAALQSDILAEFRMRVSFIGRASASSRIATEPQYYEWVGPYGNRTIDLGLIDLTSMTNPFMSHPYTGTVLQIIIYARTQEEIVSDTADVIGFLRGYLVPAQDEYSYMQAGWKNDGAGREVYSNYDAGNPYIAEESVNLFDGNLSGRVSMGLDATYGGNIVTLIPNVKQTILFVPMLSVSQDWRAAGLQTNGETGDTYVAIRPRYLHLPG